MKLIILILIFSIALFISAQTVIGDEYIPPENINLEYNGEHITSITTGMSATVPENSCNTCLKEQRPRFCLDICEQENPKSVMYY